MPKFQAGDMWSVYDDADLFIFTSNGYVTRGGQLVMGRGIALEVKDHFPEAATHFGMFIRNMGKAENGIMRYGFLPHADWPDCKLAAFQVKMNFSDNASLDLIRQSTRMLQDWCRVHPTMQVHMNFPGIGFGHIPHKEGEIKDILSILPETVTIWRLPI